jgi:hypothetical protein
MCNVSKWVRRRSPGARVAAFTVALACAASARAQYDLGWRSVDGGGVMHAGGGTFELGGTIGQPDAGSFTMPMTGGTFELSGGFWVVTGVCECPGDMNGDGQKDGRDVQSFVSCMITAAGCDCADVDGLPGVNASDIDTFVSDLLGSAGCP